MNLKEEIKSKGEPEQIEILYRDALRKGDHDGFKKAIIEIHREAPENLLFTVWYFRLKEETETIGDTDQDESKKTSWQIAIPLSIITGLIFWGLSDFDKLFLGTIPHLVLLWSPIATISAIVYLVVTARKSYKRAIGIALGLVVATLYVFLLAPTQGKTNQNYYLTLMTIHLPLLSWIGIGLTILGFNSNSEDRFAFLMKSIETMITAGLFLIFGSIFGTITFGLFNALGIDLPEIIKRLIFAGGFGLIPVLAVATAYNSNVSPSKQDFERGMSRFIFTLTRLLLPLTLIVLLVYLFIIPFRFMEPFKQREILIVYNVMLFAVIGLLIGVTPIRLDDLSMRTRKALRIGILFVAGLASLISVYALSAILYRTIQGQITINRLAVIGWNSINIILLGLLLFRGIKSGKRDWHKELQKVFSFGTNMYILWGIFLVIFIPLLFR